MADVTLHAHHIPVVSVRPHLDQPEPFAVVRLDERDCYTTVHVTPKGVRRAREIAAALHAAADAVEDAERRRNAVPIESLAPAMSGPEAAEVLEWLTRPPAA